MYLQLLPNSSKINDQQPTTYNLECPKRNPNILKLFYSLLVNFGKLVFLDMPFGISKTKNCPLKVGLPLKLPGLDISASAPKDRIKIQEFTISQISLE